MDPYSEGRNVDRNQPHRNPYPPGTVEWNQWEDGYEDAQGKENSQWVDEKQAENNPWWDERYD